MKIIFDSEEQKKGFTEHFFADYCPGILGLRKNCHDHKCDCDECWAHSGLEMEVKNE